MDGAAGSLFDVFSNFSSVSRSCHGVPLSCPRRSRQGTSRAGAGGRVTPSASRVSPLLCRGRGDGTGVSARRAGGRAGGRPAIPRRRHRTRTGRKSWTGLETEKREEREQSADCRADWLSSERKGSCAVVARFSLLSS